MVALCSMTLPALRAKQICRLLDVVTEEFHPSLHTSAKHGLRLEMEPNVPEIWLT